MINAPTSEPPKAGWEVKTLDEVCGFQNGFAFKSSKFREEGIPILRISNIQDDEIDTRKIVYTDPNDYRENLDRYRVCKNDLLIAMSGATTGKIGFNTSDTTFLLNQRVGKFEPGSSLRKRFLYFYLLTKVEENLRIAAGAAQPNLSTEQIKSFLLPVPPLAEQERIVGILDEAFEGIAAATAQAEKNLHNARELFQSVLQSTFSQKGDDWVKTTLGEVCELISGQHILAGDYNTTHKGIGYLTGPADFGEFNPIVTRWTEKPKSTAKSDDILITVKGSGVGKINILTEEEVAISRQLMAIRLNDTVSLKFIYFFMNLQFAFFQDLSTGAAIPGISRKDVLSLLLNLPPLPTQQAIVEKLDALSEETKRLEAIYERKQAALSELKQSLLQKAFAGEL
jgi:type I restriction enzyme S subunit